MWPAVLVKQLPAELLQGTKPLTQNVEFLSFSPAAAAATLLPYAVLCSACPSGAVLRLHVVGVSLKLVLQSENYLKMGIESSEYFSKQINNPVKLHV